MEAADALNTNDKSAPATGANGNASDKPADDETKSFANSGTTVITPKKTVTVADAIFTSNGMQKEFHVSFSRTPFSACKNGKNWI